MRVLANLCFLKFITEVRNKMLFIILTFLIKHVINFIIKRIYFYIKNNVLIIMFQNENNDKHLL